MARRYDTDWKETDRKKTEELTNWAVDICHRRGLAYTAIGLRFCKDSHLVTDLLSGKRRLLPKTQVKLRAFLTELDQEPNTYVPTEAEQLQEELRKLKICARRLLRALDDEDAGDDFNAAFDELKRLSK